MSTPDPAAVTSLIAGEVTAAVQLLRHTAKAYTRGRGFTDDEPNDEIGAVIALAAARLVANPSQIPVDNTAGPFSQSLRGSFNGWTTAELVVLNRYRVRAQ